MGYQQQQHYQQQREQYQQQQRQQQQYYQQQREQQPSPEFDIEFKPMKNEEYSKEQAKALLTHLAQGGTIHEFARKQNRPETEDFKSRMEQLRDESQTNGPIEIPGWN